MRKWSRKEVGVKTEKSGPLYTNGPIGSHLQDAEISRHHLPLKKLLNKSVKIDPKFQWLARVLDENFALLPILSVIFILFSFTRALRNQPSVSVFLSWGHISGHLAFLFFLFLCFKHLLMPWIRNPNFSLASAEH